MGTAETSATAGKQHYRFGAALTAAAGAVHLAAGATHMADGLALGIAFVVTGWLQLLLGAKLSRGVGDRRWLLATIVTHVGVLSAWLVSRTAGLPVLHPEPEAFAVAGILTMLAEIGAIAILGRHLARSTGPSTGRRATTALVATWALVLAGSTAAVADLGTDTHGHAEESAASHSDEGHSDEGGHGGSGHDDAESSSEDDGTADDRATSDASTPDDRTSSQSTTEDGSTDSGGDTSSSSDDGAVADDGHDHTHDG